MTAKFDLVKFINDGFDSQQKYAEKVGELGPYDLATIDAALAEGIPQHDGMPFRYAKIIEMMSHMIEETIEARVFIPRRSWKSHEPSYLDSPKLRKEFIAECFDILLFHRAILAYAGVTGEEFAEVAMQKMEYNKKRPDHKINGDVSACSDPLAELRGDCPSSDYDQ